MNKIIKILGSSGAGKTTVIRDLMTKGPVIKWADNHPGYYVEVPDCPLAIVGRYEANCGGVDTLSGAAEAIKWVEAAHPFAHVIYEGLLQSTYYGRMGTWSQQYGDDFIYALLNTPETVCMDRLHARREKNGTKRPLNVPQAQEKYWTVRRAFDKAKEHGHRCVELQWDGDTSGQILELLK